MNIYLSKIAEEKYKSLAKEDKELVNNFVKHFDNNTKNNCLYYDTNEIYSAKINDEISVFYSKTLMNNSECTIILDFTKIVRENNALTFQVIPSLNPNRNPSINPNRNPSINPDRNPSINPNRNPSINPNRNPSINPNRNPSINPNRNPSINPDRNPSINPDRNPSINPNRNPSINYKRNRSYTGPFRYNRDLKIEGVIVRINDKVMLHFNMDLKLNSYSIAANDQIQVLFDVKNSWIGYLIHCNNVFLVYNCDNDWIATII
ncbi:MAG: hypothetical protein J6T62_11650 [Fibrobacter sp.]|nr:hypothetical protein [Fibrobacter sp.]